MRLEKIVNSAKAHKTSVTTLTRKAEKDAIRRGNRPDHLAISPADAFGEWAGLASIAPHLLMGNASGLGFTDCLQIGQTYCQTYLQAQATTRMGVNAVAYVRQTIEDEDPSLVHPI